MKKITVLIADNNPLLLEQLKNEITSDEQLELIGITDNGRDAYNIITKSKPDIVVFDLLLPYYDGFSLIEKVKSHRDYDKNIKFVMSTPITNDSLISETFRRGVDYVIAKPYDVNIITEKIKAIFTFKNTVQCRTDKAIAIDEAISKNLVKVGIPASLTGYRYMVTAIKTVINDESALDGVTKILYPEVAKQHHSTPQRVEKAIRHAIEVAWDRNSENSYNPAFKFSIKNGKHRPTNSEFIAVLSQHVKLSA